MSEEGDIYSVRESGLASRFEFLGFAGVDRKRFGDGDGKCGCGFTGFRRVGRWTVCINKDSRGGAAIDFVLFKLFRAYGRDHAGDRVHRQEMIVSGYLFW